jgi:hypothetical protein
MCPATGRARRGNGRTPRSSRSLALLAGLLLASPRVAAAQPRPDRLVEFELGAVREQLQLFGAGVPEPDVATGGVRTLRRIESTVAPLLVRLHGRRVTLDVATHLADHALSLTDSSGRDATARLRGVGDVRLRLTSPLLGGRLLVTAGTTLPTGREALNGEELTTLRVLSTPALGTAGTAASNGLGATAGLVASGRTGAVSWAAGGSYEHRQLVRPLDVLVVGSPATELLPAHTRRLFGTVEVPLGPHRAALSVHREGYGTDQLRVTGAPTDPIATLTLGAVHGADAQLVFDLASSSRRLEVWSGVRHRARHIRDDQPVPASDARFWHGGTRVVLDARDGVQVDLAVDGRWQSGFGLPGGFATQEALSGGITIGVAVRRTTFSWQPFVRLSDGRVRPRANPRPDNGTRFGGVALGMTLRGGV